MIKKVKKWVPFFMILLIALTTFINMVLFSENPYKPVTDDPLIIYYEACSSCHGDEGISNSFIYPSLLTGKYPDKLFIKRKITEGGWLMPRFNNIKGDTLINLVELVNSNDFGK
jgi:hypothetical protein